MQVRILLAGVLLAGMALVAGAEPAAARPGETPAERIARETVAAVRASERAGLTTSLAPVPRRLAVAGPLAGRWTTCQLPEGFNPVHASVLPDGTVLLMDGSGNDPAEFAAGH